MTFSNVRLILAREIRDQLRDRRTLFMIAVLPILLYPLLGLSFFQVSQFMQEQPTRVLVVDAPELTGLPPLFENEQFSPQVFTDVSRARLLDLHFAGNREHGADDDLRRAAYRRVESGEFEAALYFPADFGDRLEAFRKAIRQRMKSHEPREATVRLEIPNPEIIYSTANDKSQIAFARLSEVLHRWTEQIGNDNLAQSGMPMIAARPFSIESADVADAEHRQASMWSKLLPMLMLLWALTGAFYPAVDLCAGEKERGTLETLLCSPALRSEIVVGKLATVMLFSIFTAVLNLVSMGITGQVVAAHLPGLGMPPATAIAALLLALLPISALFSALCLALAAFARSSKEGQYYLMPLLLVVMPLVILPMSPGVELNFGNSLIPITGVVLLLRSVLEGNYWQAVQFLPAVVVVTALACLLSIRWAVEQFNAESVLFRESERLEPGLWLRRLVRDRKATPSAAAAVFCGISILVIHFFVSLSQGVLEGFGDLARMALTTQGLVIALPTLAMTVFLARSPRETLLLKWPGRLTIPAAALLAMSLHPSAILLQSVVGRLYPVSESVRPALEQMQALLRQTDLWPLLLVIALTPAICEELAFRGFILSGFRHLGHPWQAVIFSAIFFGVTHGILQQSLIASLLGVLLGFLALQSGSILPGMAFHFVHNTLAVLNGRITPESIPDSPLLRRFVTPLESGGCVFQWPLIVAGLLAAILIVCWFARLNRRESPEEELEASIQRGARETTLLVREEAC
jgi:sodium transport system permease protein